MRRPKRGSPDAAPGTVSCIVCLLWPTIHKMSGGYWVAYCSGNCPTVVTAGTRQAVMDEWNDRNRR